MKMNENCHKSSGLHVCEGVGARVGPFGSGRTVNRVREPLQAPLDTPVTTNGKRSESASRSAGKSQHTYFIQGQSGGNIKIGKAFNPQKRMRCLQLASPEKLVLLGTIPEDCEQALHFQFRDDRQHGEWFAPSLALVNFIRKAFGSIAIPGADIITDEKRDLFIATAGGGEWMTADELEEHFALQIEEEGHEPGCNGDTAGKPDRDYGSFIQADCPACGLASAVNGILENAPVGGILDEEEFCSFTAVLTRPSGRVATRRLMKRLAWCFLGFDLVDIEFDALLVGADAKPLKANIVSILAEVLRGEPFPLPGDTTRPGAREAVPA